VHREQIPFAGIVIMAAQRVDLQNASMLSKLMRPICAIAMSIAGVSKPLFGQADTESIATQRLLDSLRMGHGTERCFYRTALQELPGRSLTACRGTDADTLTYFYRDSTGILVAARQVVMDERTVRTVADSVRRVLIQRYGAGFSCSPTTPGLLYDRTMILWHEWYIPGGSVQIYVISYGAGTIRPMLAVEAIVGQRYCPEWLPPPMYY